MTLVEIVREAAKHNFNYVAVDSNGKVYAYDKKPVFAFGYWGLTEGNSVFICSDYDINCMSMDALIKISDLHIDLGRNIFGRIA